jgi:effector-binding domain-containing protein
MPHEVVAVDVVARPTLVVAARTTWAEFPRLWKPLLDEVWGCLRACGIERGCPNVMLYRDDIPNVEVGVVMDGRCNLTGQVVRSSLPSGRVATTVYRGPYSGLAEAHAAVIEWCDANGEHVTRTRWEIYGPHADDPSELWTEVYWLLG